MPSFDFDHDQGLSPPSYRAPTYEPLGGKHRPDEKVNTTTRNPARRSTKGSVEYSLDNYLDGVRGGGAVVDIDMNRNGNALDFLPNGRPSTNSRDNKSSLRTDSPRSTNRLSNASENEKRGPLMHSNTKTGQGVVPTSSTTVNGLPLMNGEGATRAVINGESDHKTIIIPPPISTNPQSTGPLTYNTSLHPSPTTETTAQTATSPAYSAPPSYPPPRAPSPSATPVASSFPAAPSGPPPPPPPLKHRHTLQVPQVGLGRSSSDGLSDIGRSTGRFSPTTARRASMTINRRNTQSVHSTVPHEEPPHDEDAARWAEMVRQKRASKRRRKDEEDDDRVVVGTKVDMNHVNWVTAYNMLTGIRFTVSRTNAKLDRQLTDADFGAKHKFSFDITGNELTPSAKYDFKFKDYAPWVFRTLRSKFRLDPADYLMSLTSKYILSELGSPGKSGSFFYFSRDYKYIIKTIHHAEHKFLRKILKDYYTHVEDNPNTLLSQFYGLHRVKMPYGRKIHFVVMNNLFPPHRDIHQTFDLKGSTVGRDYKEEQLEKNPRATLKDLNWLRRHLHLEFGPEKKRLFIEQMERDVKLLQRLKIMDYSMLIGVHDLATGNQENLRDKTLQVFQPGGEQSASESPGPSGLMRTASKLETARKAQQLREIIKQEKPVPMGQSATSMQEEMEENPVKRDFTFYGDDGGFQATHEDNMPGDEIYYLGIIDCLTHYGMVKRLEHFWKGLSHDKQQISPVPSVPYGDRFIKFMTGITKTREEGEREKARELAEAQADATVSSNPQVTPAPRRRSNSQPVPVRTMTENSVIERAELAAARSEKRGASEDWIPERILHTDSVPAARGTSSDTPTDRMMLPMVDEAGEASSTGDRSGADSREEMYEKEDRPLTPPKDGLRPMPQMTNGGVRGSPISSNLGSQASPRNSFDSMKDLPPLPTLSNSSSQTTFTRLPGGPRESLLFPTDPAMIMTQRSRSKERTSTTSTIYAPVRAPPSPPGSAIQA